MHGIYNFQEALLFYDYFLTFDKEIQLFWNRKLTGPSVIFYLNRYSMLVNAIAVILQYPTVIPQIPMVSICATTVKLVLTYSSEASKDTRASCCAQ